MTRFAGSTPGDLDAIADALEDGRCAWPATSGARLPAGAPPGIGRELEDLAARGFAAAQAVTLVRALAAERRANQDRSSSLELVVTGPDPLGIARDTRVVVEQLFEEARSEILVAGFALFDGATVLRRLAERYEVEPDLKVTLCLDISRHPTDTTRDSDLIAAYMRDFRERHWRGRRQPPVYFDPRGLALASSERAVLHAKCIVVDRRLALVTSANLTPAAHEKNIELGVLVTGGTIPGLIADHFAVQIRSGVLAAAN